MNTFERFHVGLQYENYVTFCLGDEQGNLHHSVIFCGKSVASALELAFPADAGNLIAIGCRVGLASKIRTLLMALRHTF
jgi:hypothetical protein